MNEDGTSDRTEKLHRELDAAFKNRADLYRLFLEELTAEFGAEHAEKAMVRVIEERGREVARAAFHKFGPNDAVALGNAFLAASPDGGRLYPTDVERSDRSILFMVRRCPLKEAWVEAGVSDEKLVSLCRIAGAFDRGLFETAGVRFENITWSPGHGSGCCHIRLTDRDAAGFVEGSSG